MTRIAVDYGEVEALAARGLTRNAAASALGIKQPTFSQRMARDPRFREAWRRGSERAERVNRATSPDATARLSDDERAVVAALKGGIKWRGEIRDTTGLDYARINRRLFT